MPTKGLEYFSGWGNNIRAPGKMQRITSIESARQALEQISDGRGALPVGAFRSYGDSALNSGGTLLDATGLKSIEINAETKIAIVGAGVTIAELERAALKHNLFPPVVPGTGFVTMGGAVAADIHGKSHHKTGSFSRSVRSMTVLLSDGSVQKYSNADDEFWATVGGLGLTGFVLELEILLREVKSNAVDVNEQRVSNLSQMLEVLSVADQDYEHTVAWIDLSGKYEGRGVVSLGNYGGRSVKGEAKSSGGTLSVPSTGANLINSATVRVFNEAWFRKPLKQGPVALGKYMHPLDGVQNWNRIYGSAGFLQYQFVIEEGQEALFEKLFAGLRQLKAASFLGVLKKFGPGSQGYLSFPKPGWTLTLDYSVTVKGLERFLHDFDEELASAGGRIYLVKDSRLSPSLVPIMYPDLIRWQSVREKMDPLHLWQSDQARRLQLC